MKPAFLALLVCALWALPVALAQTPGQVAIGSMLREATMHGLNGPDRSLSSFRGKPLLINVWASWCGPCRAEMNSLEQLAWSKWAARFNVIGISTDDDPEQAKALLKRTNSTFSQFIDSARVMENMLGASHLPVTVLVDKKGRVVRRMYGAMAWNSPEALTIIGSAFEMEPPDRAN
ncbi:MAG TPA: TlpA disulfide reductase family protein [Steroidobacteraceae bacterium]|nr:TlpA disulfide reductase family protein [Steroidobacteraceae bacterium]